MKYVYQIMKNCFLRIVLKKYFHFADLGSNRKLGPDKCTALTNHKFGRKWHIYGLSIWNLKHATVVCV